MKKQPTIGFGKYKKISVYEVPIDYFKWMAEVKIIDRVRSYNARYYICHKLGLPPPEKKYTVQKPFDHVCDIGGEAIEYFSDIGKRTYSMFFE